jgi:acetoacetyl-CoA reductase
MNMSRVAIVTGGTRGIGASIAKALQGIGYKVAANYAKNHAAAEEFTKATGIATYSWDVARYSDCVDGVARVEKDLGVVDILVNNAGITRDSAFHKMSEDDWNAVIDTNLRSCYTMTRAVFDGMRTRSYGRIVNISSINGQAGQFGQANYAAAKAGMIGFTKALALEGARKGITVNAVSPGYINTEMVAAIDDSILQQIVDKIPVGRLGEPEEIARTVMFLVDERSGFITGATFNVNGGQYR